MFHLSPHFHISITSPTVPPPPLPPSTPPLPLLPPPLIPQGHFRIGTTISDIPAGTSHPSPDVACQIFHHALPLGNHHGYYPTGLLGEGCKDVLSNGDVFRRNLYDNEPPLDDWRHLGACHVCPVCLVDFDLEVLGVMLEDSDPPPVPACCIRCKDAVPRQRNNVYSVVVLGEISPVSESLASSPPRMSIHAPTPSLQMGGTPPLIALLALHHAILPCPFCPVPPSHQPPQRLTAPVPRSCSHPPLPRSNVITFASGLCSARIPGQVVVRVPVAVYATHGTAFSGVYDKVHK